MVFDARSLPSGYLIQYYDANMNYKSSRVIETELPIFGGFYSDGTYYYVLSGQENLTESNSTEVYRVTRYDKNWNRYSVVASLYGANTYIPFDGGSARFTHDGSQLFIRSCHEMYKTTDGYHHQASVMIKVNTTTMKVQGSQYAVANSGAGYVSHSFNEFIRLDGGYVLAVDHGDAHPRGIVLLKSTSKYSTASYSNTTRAYNIQPFSGSEGENTTGASIGGFEISSTDYLVAYNRNDQNNFSTSKTRNIYVAAMNKSDSQVDYYQFTDYSEGAESAQTPCLVKLATDSMLLMWYRDDKVCYCKLNGEGQLLDNRIYYMQGALSDCEPVKNGSNVSWCVSYSDRMIFYTIDCNNLLNTSTKVITFGHRYNVNENSEIASVRTCVKCGKEKTMATGFSIYYNCSALGYGGYGSISNGNTLTWDCSKKFTLWYYSYTPEDAEVSECELLIDDTSIVKKAMVSSSDSSKILFYSGTESGRTLVTFRLRYNPKVKRTFYIKVSHNYTVTGTKDEGKIQVETCTGCGATRETKLQTECEVVGASAKLSSNIEVDFRISDLPENGWVVIDGSSGKTTYSVSSLLKDDQYYIVPYDVYPKYMRENHSLYVLDANSKKTDIIVNGITTDTMRWNLYDFLESQIKNNSSNENLVNLAKALIVYCDNVAYYFDGDNAIAGVKHTSYSATSLATSYAKTVYSNEAESGYSEIAGVEYLGTSLLMHEIPGMRHYFYGNLSKCTLTIDGKSCALKKYGDNLYYYDDFEAIQYSALPNKKAIILTENSTGIKWKMDYSVMAYVKDVNDMGNGILTDVCLSLYNVYVYASRVAST